jgi:hypothetical protein
MEKELLQSLAETKSYLREWIKQSDDRTPWEELANDISHLQLELALSPDEMQSDIHEVYNYFREQQ